MYGAIGAVIVLLVWFYLSGLVLLFGAELNSEIEHAAALGGRPRNGSHDPTGDAPRHGQPIDLTFREFELLNYPMRHEGRPAW